MEPTPIAYYASGDFARAEARSDLEKTPQFREGRVNTLGLAFNTLLTKRHALALRYLNRDADQAGAASGSRIPFVARHFAQVDSQWSFGGQWLLGAGATWRSERFRDDANTMALRAGWVFNFTVYWESIDKRSIVQAIVGNLLPEKAAALEPDPKVTLRYAYRF